MSCATLTTPPHVTPIPVGQAQSRFPIGVDPADFCAPANGYLIYCLEELASGRHYVGLTGRSLKERISSHLTQARRNRRVRPGGLMAALQLMESAGQSFLDCYSVRILARAGSVAEARALEGYWVARLESRTPVGLNDMPGGSSAGAINNAQSISVCVNDSETRNYPTIRDAIIACNGDRQACGQPRLEASTVYARVACGWTPEEALGIRPRKFLGSVRRAIAIGDHVFATLHEASEATGLLPSTLSSRLHRVSRSNAAGVPQIGSDRRARGPGRLALLGLSWPGTSERLTAAQYAVRTGAPKATIMHRWHRVRAILPAGTVLPAKAVHAFLTAPAAGKRGAAEALARLLSRAVTSRSTGKAHPPATTNHRSS